MALNMTEDRKKGNSDGSNFGTNAPFDSGVKETTRGWRWSSDRVAMFDAHEQSKMRFLIEGRGS